MTYPEQMLQDFGGSVERLAKDTTVGSLANLADMVDARHLASATGDPSGVRLSLRTTWCMAQWLRSNKPLLVVADDLRDLLLSTDLPKEVELPHLPFKGFYLSVSGFTLTDQETGEHPIEGAFIAEDDFQGEPRITVVGVGAPLPGATEERKARYLRNDTLQYVDLSPGADLDKLLTSAAGSGMGGFENLLRLVLNLLYLMGTEQSAELLARETVSPPNLGVKKAKRAQRQGRSLLKYVHLSLSSKATSKTPPRPAEAYDGPWTLSMVRGHFRSYWVKDPQAAKVLEIREDRKRILKFIPPHQAWRRGEGSQSNTYKVVG